MRQWRVVIPNLSKMEYKSYDVAVADAQKAMREYEFVTLEQREIGAWEVIVLPFVTEEDATHA